MINADAPFFRHKQERMNTIKKTLEFETLLDLRISYILELQGNLGKSEKKKASLKAHQRCGTEHKQSISLTLAVGASAKRMNSLLLPGVGLKE